MPDIETRTYEVAEVRIMLQAMLDRHSSDLTPDDLSRISFTLIDATVVMLLSAFDPGSVELVLTELLDRSMQYRKAENERILTQGHGGMRS